VIILELFPYITIIILNAFIVTKIYESMRFRGRFDHPDGPVRQREGKRVQQQENETSPRPAARPRARYKKSASILKICSFCKIIDLLKVWCG